MNTPHSTACRRVFARLDPSCPRCQELAAGAPSHGIARVEETVTTRGSISYWVPDCTGGEPIRYIAQGGISGALPPPIKSGPHRHYLTPRGEAPHSGQRRVWFVVSAMTALALRAAGDFREDVLIPRGEVRDGGGRIIGVRAFARYVLALNS